MIEKDPVCHLCLHPVREGQYFRAIHLECHIQYLTSPLSLSKVSSMQSEWGKPTMVEKEEEMIEIVREGFQPGSPMPVTVSESLGKILVCLESMHEELRSIIRNLRGSSSSSTETPSGEAKP